MACRPTKAAMTDFLLVGTKVVARHQAEQHIEFFVSSALV
ncbi:hypothetical protein VCJ_000581 [Vibrio metoecus]|nr:hypothetical protein VCJ_000581 [Vibrio metoecus]